jgi:hypothetical protein
MTLDYADGIQLILKAFAKAEERKAWDLYVVKFQHMDKKNYMTFSKFYKQAQGQAEPKQTTEEIRKIAEVVKKKHQAKRK